MRRRGYTVLEVALAVGMAGVLLYALFSILTSGSRLFSKGVGAARGPEGALIVMDQIERDALQCLQIPGDPRPPVALASQGRELALYVPRPLKPGATRVVGEPVRWALEKAAGEPGHFHPRRGAKVFRSIVITGWEFELLEPDEEEDRRGWYLVVRIRFARESKESRDFLVARLIHLAQPSSNFLHFPDHGADLEPARVYLLPGPEEHPIFKQLGPPEVMP